MNRAERRATKANPRIWYGLCTYWTDDWSKLVVPGVPRCPHCGSPGFQIDEDEWWAGAERYEREGNTGYRRFLESHEAECNGRGVTLLSLWDLFASQDAGASS